MTPTVSRKLMSRPDGSSRRSSLTERLARIDPGSIRLVFALSGAVSVGAAIGAEYLFVHWTGALHISTPPGAPTDVAQQVHQANHGYLIIAELLGAVIALICSISAVEPTAHRQLVAMAWIPLPLVAGLTAAVALTSERVWSLVAVVAATGITGYLRKYGSRGLTAGLGLFMGFFVGFSVGGRITIGEIGWLIAEAGVATIVVVVVHLVVFRPNPDTALERMNQSFQAQSSELLLLAEAALLADDAGSERRLRRCLVRYNQTSLMLDAKLANAGLSAAPTCIAHERVFDMEHAVADVARAAYVVADAQLAAPIRVTMRLAVLAVQQGDIIGARVLAGELEGLPDDQSGRHVAAGNSRDDEQSVALARFVNALIRCADVIETRHNPAPLNSTDRSDQPSIGATPLVIGWLPGTSIVSARASASSGPGSPYTQLNLSPYLRTAIQLTVATAAAIVIGDRVSGQRVIWAVLTVFLVCLGPLNAAEQVSRAVLRVAATAAGLVAVVGIDHLVGANDAAAIVVVVTTTFLAMFMMRTNAAFMAAGLTVVSAQLLVQLQQYGDAVLRLRIGEIGVGAACAIVTVLLVVPLYPSRVLRTALQGYLGTVVELLQMIGQRLAPANRDRNARAAARDIKPLIRRLDLAYQALLAAAASPSRLPRASKTHRAKAFAAAAQLSHRDLRLMASLLRTLDQLDGQSRSASSVAAQTMAASSSEILAHLDDNSVHNYQRTELDAVTVHDVHIGHEASAVRLTPGMRADLANLDDALAELAALLGMPVLDAAAEYVAAPS